MYPQTHKGSMPSGNVSLKDTAVLEGAESRKN